MTSRFHIESNQLVSLSLVLCHEHEIKREKVKVDLHIFNLFLFLEEKKSVWCEIRIDATTKEHAVNCIILSRHIITSCAPICPYVHIHIICMNQQERATVMQKMM